MRGVLSFILVTAISMTQAYGGDSWVQNRFAEFRAGTFADGGANLYVAASGQIRSIYTFDYNHDGANDIMFVDGHNVNDAPPTYIYLNNGGGLDRRFRWALLNDGAKSGLVSDFNRDGYPDVVVCGTSNGMATRAPLDSIVYFGSDKGFFPTESVRLPTFYPSSVVSEDLNRDGLDDLVFPQSGDRNAVIYWNIKGSFDVGKKTELHIKGTYFTAADLNGDGLKDLIAVTAEGVNVYRGNGETFDLVPVMRLSAPGATRALATDLNLDGRADLVIANGNHTADSWVFWNDGKKFASQQPTRLPTSRASGTAVGDLNGDGNPDLVFANTSLEDGRTGKINSVVYWGSKTGFNRENKLELPTEWASQCGVGDINHDGYPDVVFANRTSLSSMDTESFVYWGGKDGPSVKRRQSLPTRGATDLMIADVNGDKLNDLVFFNGGAGFNGERGLRIYWNSGKGAFSPERKTEIPSYDSFSAVAADFNNDGYLDIAVPNSYEYSLQGKDVDQGSFVYWGDQSETWDVKRRTTLKTRTASGIVSADLNHDGYLDLVIPQYADPEHRQLIFWGAKDGFNDDHISVLHMPNPRGLTLADFNKDGWLDIVIADLDSPEIPIFWGGPEGYSDSRKTGLPNGGSVTANAADFNNDGWLDLFVCNFYEGKHRIENTNSFLYWGSAKGFDAERRTMLPTVGGDQTTAADFNKDGYVDLAIGNYATGAHDRTWFSYVYWNGPEGFKPAHRSDLYTNAGSGNLALDFNKDGWLDLVMACHKQANGDHSTYSYLFWGGPEGFQDWNKIEMPTDGAHETTFMDAGNIYNRRFELGYVSSVYDAHEVRRVSEIEWKAEEPLSAKLKFELHGADSREELANMPWRTRSDELQPARFWQYRVTFVSADGSNYPVLKEVKMLFK